MHIIIILHRHHNINIPYTIYLFNTLNCRPHAAYIVGVIVGRQAHYSHIIIILLHII